MIPTLAETLASQNDLEDLCADRTIRTNETFYPNAYYGIGSILKLYAGLPLHYPLKVATPHGIYFKKDWLWKVEKDTQVPLLLCYPSYLAEMYRNHTRKLIIPAASPFLYAVELLKEQPKPARRGTIFFPIHSAINYVVYANYEKLADCLTQLDEEYKPVTVCMYWKDILLQHHLPFLKRGFQVVSAGHLHDPNFMFRLYHLCSFHRYAASPGSGSHLFYSVQSGCSFFYYGDTPSHYRARNHVHDYSKIKDLSAHLLTFFAEAQSAITADQQHIVDYYTGAENLMPPGRLRDLLLAAEVFDKIGSVQYNSNLRAEFSIPTYYRRMSQQAMQPLRYSLVSLGYKILNALRQKMREYGVEISIHRYQSESKL